jgi:hypothetical protein
MAFKDEDGRGGWTRGVCSALFFSCETFHSHESFIQPRSASFSLIQPGKGTYCWPDGSFYKGTFSHGKKHGMGEYTWASGSSYKGENRILLALCCTNEYVLYMNLI